MLLDMAVEATDEAAFLEVQSDLTYIKTRLDDLELKSLLNGEVDINSAYISINAGAGLGDAGGQRLHRGAPSSFPMRHVQP